MTTAPSSPGTRTALRAPRWLQGSIAALEREGRIDGAGNVLQPVAAKLAAGRRGSALRGDWLGHALHPLLTDFPLGCFMAANFLDLVGGRRARPAARRLIGIGLLAVPPTAATGMTDWNDVRDPRARRVGVVHAMGNTMVALFYLLSWRARRRGRHAMGVGFGLAGGALAWVTGYLGGHLSFARRVGTGERGLGEDSRDSAGVGREAGADPVIDLETDQLLDADDAALLLGVGREQLDAMVEQGMLVARSEDGGDPRFAESEVTSVRLAGG